MGMAGNDVSIVTRGSATLRVERPFGGRRVVTSTVAAAARGTHGIPPQELALFGGPASGPGYEYHSLAATAGVSQRLELQLPVPFPGMALGRFGRAPAQATLAPYVHAVALGGPQVYAWRRDGRGAPLDVDGFPASAGVHPSVGVGFLGFFDLVRIDVARGLRDGRWWFGVDVNRDFWRIL